MVGDRIKITFEFPDDQEVRYLEPVCAPDDQEVRYLEPVCATELLIMATTGVSKRLVKELVRVIDSLIKYCDDGKATISKFSDGHMILKKEFMKDKGGDTYRALKYLRYKLMWYETTIGHAYIVIPDLENLQEFKIEVMTLLDGETDSDQENDVST
jgi:hypothetical protein